MPEQIAATYRFYSGFARASRVSSGPGASSQPRQGRLALPVRLRVNDRAHR